MRANRYGVALFLYKANTGMKIMSIASIECVGPLCSMNGIRISMSGITERVKINGRLISVFSNLDVDLLIMYPIDRWPTAYEFLFLRFLSNRRIH